MEGQELKIKKEKTLKSKNREQLLFYYLVLLLPIVQFIIFYVVINFRSILLAFQDYDIEIGYSFIGFINFKTVFQNFASGLLWKALFNSLMFYGFNLLIGTGLGLLFSYYIYKKFPFAEFFRVMLFLPHIISAVVMGIIYANVVDKVLSKFIGPTIMMKNELNGFWLVMFFSLWTSFGTNVLIYVSSMSGISTEVVESAQIDGVNSIKEFWFITLPMVYPTIITFITVGLAGLFTNQMNLYTFYGISPPNEKFYNIGYYIYSLTKEAKLENYPYLSSFGLILTIVAVPLTLGVKRAMEKLGPSVE